MPLERARELLRRHLTAARRLLPETPVFDAHTHLGLDEDGRSQTPEELLEQMRATNVTTAFTFPLNDPERHPAYRRPNDRVLAWADGSGGALLPFCRLDLADGPVEEARRCLERGARGIKLHPRAQGFGFGERGLDPIFRLAAEWRVPILIHAGRGLPPIADDLLHLLDRHPNAQLILAHAAISDLARLGRTLRELPNVCYDTSVWSSVDIRTLLAVAAPEQILHASDAPYGTPAISQVQIALALRAAGADHDACRLILRENAERVARGEPAGSLSTPLGRPTLERPLGRIRIHEYLVMAAALLWLRERDAFGVLALARRACDGDDAGALAEVDEALGAAEELWLEMLELEEPGERAAHATAAFRLLQVANALVLDA